MTRYFVYTSGVLVEGFDTYEEAENKVIAMRHKYEWMNPKNIYIKEVFIDCRQED